MEYYDLSLNDLNLIRHLRKSRETFIRFTYNKNIQEKVEVGRLRRPGYYDLSLNDLSLIRHLRKSRETFIRFTAVKEDLKKVRSRETSQSGFMITKKHLVLNLQL